MIDGYRQEIWAKENTTSGAKSHVIYRVNLPLLDDESHEFTLDLTIFIESADQILASEYSLNRLTFRVLAMVKTAKDSTTVREKKSTSNCDTDNICFKKNVIDARKNTHSWCFLLA